MKSIKNQPVLTDRIGHPLRGKVHKIFNCGCGKDFYYRSSLRKHIKNKHNSISLKGTY